MNKIVVMALCLLFPAAAAGQNQNANMQGKEMGTFMQAMQAMQECMEKVDQEELRRLEEEGQKFEREIRDLCAKGERDKAQEQAIRYSKMMMKNPTLIQMKKCGEIAQGLMPEGSMPEPEEFDFDPSKEHVCDNME